MKIRQTLQQQSLQLNSTIKRNNRKRETVIYESVWLQRNQRWRSINKRVFAEFNFQSCLDWQILSKIMLNVLCQREDMFGEKVLKCIDWTKWLKWQSIANRTDWLWLSCLDLRIHHTKWKEDFNRKCLCTFLFWVHKVTDHFGRLFRTKRLLLLQKWDESSSLQNVDFLFSLPLVSLLKSVVIDTVEDWGNDSRDTLMLRWKRIKLIKVRFTRQSFG